MRIELVGGMGVGKTTLCRVLEEIGYNCIYEDLGENPFLARMYEDIESYKFPSQIWFILSKFSEIQMQIKRGHVNVLDQAMDNYKAYARMLFNNGSDPRGFKIVTDFFDYTEERFGLPDLLVHLQVSPETQLKRVRSRRRTFENEVTLEYLQDLKRELDGVVEESKAKGVNIIEIDTEEIFLPEHHLFAAELAENIEKRLNFCINPITKKAV
ncbi:MAG: deoxyadenosine kinase [Micavibrio sp.]|nr:deoxyadenosine kinase [Micavibrio sp.]|tara:strand:- start:138 stop:773 length:636 start_codon:yes stop_codon:yes gene_type:complete